MRRKARARIGPTKHQPGTAGKIAVMAERAAAGKPLFHPQDATLGERAFLVKSSHGTGEPHYEGVRFVLAGGVLSKIEDTSEPYHPRPGHHTEAENTEEYRASEAARKRRYRARLRAEKEQGPECRVKRLGS